MLKFDFFFWPQSFLDATRQKILKTKGERKQIHTPRMFIGRALMRHHDPASTGHQRWWRQCQRQWSYEDDDDDDDGEDDHEDDDEGEGDSEHCSAKREK